jgi:RNA polymerase sigma factor (sigma-70 family)
MVKKYSEKNHKNKIFENIFKNFSENLPKRPLQTVIVNEGINIGCKNEAGDGDGKLILNFPKSTGVESKFDSFCKQVLKNEIRNCYTELKARRSREVLFSEMTSQEMDELRTLDKYPSDFTHFTVRGVNVEVENDLLAEALSNLTETKRDIILLSYFLEMTDKEIAETLNIARRTVNFQRNSIIAKLKKLMEEKDYGQE